MSVDPVVGRPTNSGKSTAIVQQPTGAAGVNPTTPVMMGAQSRLNAANIGFNVSALGLSNPNLIDSLSPQQIAQIGTLLKKAGVSVRASTAQIKTILLTDPVYSSIASKTNSFPTLYQALLADYNPALDGGKKEKEYLPTRSLTDITDEQIGKIIDNASLAAIGSILPKKQRNAEIAKNRKLVNQGTLTTTEKVKDPKTGKSMLVTKSKTPFTAEKVTTQLDESLKTSNPKQYQLNKSLGFNDEMTKILSGGI
jgi:hypothetical protein